MNVLYVYDGHWPFQATRAIKQSDLLLAAGHHVTMLSRGVADAARHEVNGRLTVARMPHMRSRKLDKLVNYPMFLNPLWFRHVWKNAKRSNADLIIVGDLPLAPAAVLVGRVLRVPVLYDMAEVYPIAMHSLLPRETPLPLRIARATNAAFAVEKWVLDRVATTFVVSDESRDRLFAMGVDRSRVVLVGNTPANPEALRQDWPVPSDIADVVEQNRPVAIFVGNVYADRGLVYAIDAMKTVLERIPNAMMIIIGEGRDRQFLMDRAASEKLQHAVRFLGWKHHSEHPAYLKYAQIGLLPFVETEHIRITLANKLFDYMGAGVSIIASDVPSMRRVIEETDTGLLVPAGNPAALSDAMIRLFEDEALRARMRDNGFAAIEGPYDWYKDAARFMEAVERVASASRKA